MAQMEVQPMHLDDIIRQDPTHTGFCDASYLGDEGVWIDPLRSGRSIMWISPWYLEVIDDLVLATKS